MEGKEDTIRWRDKISGIYAAEKRRTGGTHKRQSSEGGNGDRTGYGELTRGGLRKIG